MPCSEVIMCHQTFQSESFKIYTRKELIRSNIIFFTKQMSKNQVSVHYVNIPFNNWFIVRERSSRYSCTRFSPRVTFTLLAHCNFTTGQKHANHKQIVS